MAAHFNIGPYEPCPCGSGKKYKFCCAEKAKANRHGKFPMGTVAYYGPDDKTITKIAAGVILSDGEEPLMQRWSGTAVATDAKVAKQIKQFFAKYGVKNVAVTDGPLGCPHEQPDDFPIGQECPFCPFWYGKQNINSSATADDLEDDEFEDEEDEDLDGEDADDDDEAGHSEDGIDRMEAVIGDKEMDRDAAVNKVMAYLKENLKLPCEVRGIEDFRWEEKYVLGGRSPAEYLKLKKTQPSYTDRYQLLSIDHDGASEWMMFWDEDISATVRRISDGKEFMLGLAELKAIDNKSENYRLIDDYAVWFVNTR